MFVVLLLIACGFLLAAILSAVTLAPIYAGFMLLLAVISFCACAVVHTLDSRKTKRHSGRENIYTAMSADKLAERRRDRGR
jgi:hypothetical protein